LSYAPSGYFHFNNYSCLP